MLDHAEIIQNVMAAATRPFSPPGFGNAPRASDHFPVDWGDRPTGAAAIGADVSAASRSAVLSVARQEGYAEGAALERQRIAGILDHPNAKGRESVARTLAFKSEMSVEQAGAFLADVPLQRSPAAGAMPANFLADVYAARNGMQPLDTADIYASRAAHAASFNRKGR